MSNADYIAGLEEWNGTPDIDGNGARIGNAPLLPVTNPNPRLGLRSTDGLMAKLAWNNWVVQCEILKELKAINKPKTTRSRG